MVQEDNLLPLIPKHVNGGRKKKGSIYTNSYDAGKEGGSCHASIQPAAVGQADGDVYKANNNISEIAAACIRIF